MPEPISKSPASMLSNRHRGPSFQFQYTVFKASLTILIQEHTHCPSVDTRLFYSTILIPTKLINNNI